METQKKKVISIVTSCWNEVDNIPLFYQRCKAELAKHPQYDYEFIVEDNLSTDGTRDVLKKIAAEDPKKPLSDDKIAQLLAKDGIKIARRTVAKYRDILGIPDTRRRKQF